MQELGGVWGRSRLMGLGPGAVVPIHVDIHYYWRTHVRIHIPVVTNPGVRFFCGGQNVHMAAGEAWVFDSFQTHEVAQRGHGQARPPGPRYGRRRPDLGADRRGERGRRSAAIGLARDRDLRALRFEQLNQPQS